MSTRAGIIAGGNWIVDHVKVIDAWPPPEALANILSQSWGNGGAPYNVLKNLSRMGATFPLEAIGLIGDDASGQLIRNDCDAHRINLAQLRVTSSAPTSYTDVMTEQTTHRRTFFHHRGANAGLSPEHFDFSNTRAKIFHLGYLLLLDALDAVGDDGRVRASSILHRARDAGLRTSIDCVSEHSDRFKSVVAPVLVDVDVLFANDFEAEKLTGCRFGRGSQLNRNAIVDAARTLVRMGVREWALIHFPEGACACSLSGDVVWQPAVAFPPKKIAGTAGAGDAFAAGVLYGLHENWPMQRALELGVCVAAASLRHPTCSEAVESMASCLALGMTHGFAELPR